MVIDRRLKYIISVQDYTKLVKNMQKATSDIRMIMNQITMTRAIYHPPEMQGNENYQWLRIRVGDTDCEMNSKCTITFKKKLGATALPSEAKIEVDDYYEATHMFDLLGFEKTSVQETKRTKFVCTYEDIKYIVCFDVWPGLEEMMFVTIDSGPNAEDIDIMGFVDLLKIDQCAKKKGGIDVDSEYREFYGTPASEIPRLKFDFFSLERVQSE